MTIAPCFTRWKWIALSLAAALIPVSGQAATWQGTSVADAFLATGSPSNPQGSDLTANNYGGAGTLAIAPASSTKGEFQSLMRFNLAPALAVFDEAYGDGNWTLTTITLTLLSNFGTQGVQPMNAIFNTINTGGFVIEWLADDSWVEGTGNPGAPSAIGVNYNSLGTLLASSHEVVGNFTYVPPGNNVPVTWTLDLTSGFLADAMQLGNVTFLFHAADTGNVGYLFNTGANAKIDLTAAAVPEPAALPLLLGAVAVLGLTLRRRRRA